MKDFSISHSEFIKAMWFSIDKEIQELVDVLSRRYTYDNPVYKPWWKIWVETKTVKAVYQRFTKEEAEKYIEDLLEGKRRVIDTEVRSVQELEAIKHFVIRPMMRHNREIRKLTHLIIKARNLESYDCDDRIEFDFKSDIFYQIRPWLLHNYGYAYAVKKT